MNGSAALSVEPVQSFLSCGTARLAELWQALRNEPCPHATRERLARMLGPWGERPIPRRPTWASDIGDDHSPYEFSVVFARNAPPQVRFLVEAQGDADTFTATLQAARDLSGSLEQDGADLSRLRQVEPVFFGGEPPLDTTFSLWHAASLEPDERHYKAYLNPCATYGTDSFEIAGRALAQLGMTHARDLLHDVRRDRGDQVRFFSLDLQADERARAKVYLYQPGATASHFESLARLAPHYRAGEATMLCRALLESEGPFVGHPLCTYLSFVEGREQPYEVTMQLPIRYYCDNDAIALLRTSRLMRSFGLDADAFERAVRVLARRPLANGPGIITHVSLRLGEPSPRVAVYLAVELYARSPRISGIGV